MISRALGHRNLDVTRRYIDMDQEVLAEATESYSSQMRCMQRLQENCYKI